jgi:hypothetical protein
MKQKPHEIRYATGEVAKVGDRVDEDGWDAVVEDVIAAPEDMARWGLDEPGLMLKSQEGGLVFEPCDSGSWHALEFRSRAEA